MKSNQRFSNPTYIETFETTDINAVFFISVIVIINSSSGLAEITLYTIFGYDNYWDSNLMLVASLGKISGRLRLVERSIFSSTDRLTD